MDKSYTPLEPVFTNSISGKSLTYDGVSSPNFYTSSSFLYTLFFVVILLAASGRYVMAGVSRMEASESGIRKSNEIFKRTTIGLLGVLSLWLILATVNKDLLSGNVGLDKLKTGNIRIDGGATLNYPNDGTANLKTLNGYGIYINHENKPCEERYLVPSATPPGCTSVDGLPTKTITMLYQLKTACDPASRVSAIVVTGGTEPGHLSHGPGKTPVDLSKNSNSLNTCIEKFSEITPPSFCKKAYNKFGYTFCDEKSSQPHWHIYQSNTLDGSVGDR